MRTAADAVPGLLRALREEGGTVAELLGDGVLAEGVLAAVRTPGPAQLAAGGPRAVGHESEYELLVEMILEGSYLHYGPERIVRTDDRDLALLVGDQLYALGLARLARLGDLEAVGQLADVISLIAQAHAATNSALADAIWRAGGTAVGWGSNPDHEAAKNLARRGDGQAAAALAEATVRMSS